MKQSPAEVQSTDPALLGRRQPAGPEPDQISETLWFRVGCRNHWAAAKQSHSMWQESRASCPLCRGSQGFLGHMRCA